MRKQELPIIIKQLAFSSCESDGHPVAQNAVCEQDLIVPPWNKILPLEACATAFVGCMELVNVRKQLIDNAALRDEAHLILFAKAFNEHLVMQGVTEKQYEDWKDHFIKWLRLQESTHHSNGSESFKRLREKLDDYNKQKATFQPYVPYVPRSKQR
jgi:hypothetical protein